MSVAHTYPSRARAWLVAALVALVLLAQGFAQAHASEFGEAPHEHDGIACAVTVLSEEADQTLPPPALVEPLPATLTEVVTATPVADPIQRPSVRAPPSRGPPTHTR